MSTAVWISLGGIAVAAISAAVSYLVSVRVTAKVIDELLGEPQGDTMSKDEKVESRLPSTSTIIIIALVAILCVAAIQVRLSNVTEHSANAGRDNAIDCLFDYKTQNEKWAAAVLDTLAERGDATQRIRSRDESWHRRVDAIFQLLISSRAGTEFTEDQIDEIASGYQRASERLFRAYAHAEVVTGDNEYPALQLSCKEEK